MKIEITTEQGIAIVNALTAVQMMDGGNKTANEAVLEKLFRCGDPRVEEAAHNALS